MSSLSQLYERGQSPWYDNLSMGLIQSGMLSGLIDQGIVGVTSNPTIFDLAISSSSDYDDRLRDCKARSLNAQETYWDLVCNDIAAAADVLKPVYDSTNGRDGYVSVEVSPTLAHKTVETIAQANELYSRISRDNVMIKIPATQEGVAAIEAVLADSIPVNVTLIFSQSRYLEVVEAFESGTAKAANPRQSVASFFISRLDTKVDALLEESSHLKGTAAIANAGIVYDLFKRRFSSLEQQSKAQRPLWASTSTKNPQYSPTKYVDALIAQNTVNTLPQSTIDALKDSERFPTDNLEASIETHKEIWEELLNTVPMDAILKELETEGVTSFEKSYESCISSIEARLEEL